MGAKKFVTIEELSELKDLQIWRLHDMSRHGLLPIRLLAGKPIIPYQIDLEKFEELESVKYYCKPKKRSLKIEEIAKASSRRKENLWLK